MGKLYTMGCVSILLGALVLRLPLLSGSFWLDEAAQAIESARPLSQQLDIIADFQPPLLHVLLHFAGRISQSEAWLRMWGALIPGLITIWATYHLGKKLLHPRVGLLAALFLALSSFHIYFSQELRPYSLAACFAVLSWLLIVTTITTPTLKNYVLFTLCTLLGLFSTYLYPFLFFSQFLFILIFRPKQRRAFAVSTISIVLLYLPWLPTFLKQLAAGGAVRTQLPGWEQVVSTPQLKALPLVFGKFYFGVLEIEFTPFFAFSSLLFLVLVGYLLRIFLVTKGKQDYHRTLLLLAMWIGITLSSAWLVSFFVPVVSPKRLLILQPAWGLLLALLIEWGRQQKNKLHRYSATGILLLVSGVSILSTYAYYTTPQLQRENWRQLHQDITTLYPTNSIAVFSFTEPFAPWRWYDSNQYPTYSTKVLHIEQVPNLANELKTITTYDHLIVFDHLRTLTDPNDVLLDTIRSFGYKETDIRDYPQIGFVRVFSKQSAILSKASSL